MVAQSTEWPPLSLLRGLLILHCCPRLLFNWLLSCLEPLWKLFCHSRNNSTCNNVNRAMAVLQAVQSVEEAQNIFELWHCVLACELLFGFQAGTLDNPLLPHDLPTGLHVLFFGTIWASSPTMWKKEIQKGVGGMLIRKAFWTTKRVQLRSDQTAWNIFSTPSLASKNKNKGKKEPSWPYLQWATKREHTSS